MTIKIEAGKTPPGLIQSGERLMAVLHILDQQPLCFCGKNHGHGGWLVCVQKKIEEMMKEVVAWPERRSGNA